MITICNVCGTREAHEDSTVCDMCVDEITKLGWEEETQ